MSYYTDNVDWIGKRWMNLFIFNLYGDPALSLYETAPGVRAPLADFYHDQSGGGAPRIVQFFDDSDNTPTSWAWSFGDGGGSGQRRPSHMYTAPGDYDVSLTASNAAGSDSETKWDYISVSPCGEMPVKRGAAGYNTIQTAYNAGGVDTTIRLQATDEYYENLIASQNKAVVLSGGYNCEFTERWMETTTTVHGKLEVRSGKVTVDNLIIR